MIFLLILAGIPFFWTIRSIVATFLSKAIASLYPLDLVTNNFEVRAKKIASKTVDFPLSFLPITRIFPSGGKLRFLILIMYS